MQGDDVEAKVAVGQAVRDACTNVGFFYAVNHGMPQEIIDETFKAAHRFFELPMDQKQAITVAGSC